MEQIGIEILSTTNIDLDVEDLKNNIEIYFFSTNKKELAKQLLLRILLFMKNKKIKNKKKHRY